MLDPDNNFNLIDPDPNHFQHNPINFKSYTIDTLAESSQSPSESFSLFHHNARSIATPGRMEEYNLLFDIIKNPFDIMIFTETWLTKDKCDLYNFVGFQSIHHLRPVETNFDHKKRGGGISLFIKNGINYKPREDLTLMLPFMESCFIELKFNHKTYLIGGIYRTPDTNANVFIEKLNEILEPLKSQYQIILMGDYNIDLMTDNAQKNTFQLCLQSNYLIPTITKPTRVACITNENGETITTESLIDNIFINASTRHLSGLIETNISDHFPIFIKIPEIAKDNINSPVCTQYRLIEEFNMKKFDLALKQPSFQNILQVNTAEVVHTLFDKEFNMSYDKHFPIKTKTLKEKDIQKPWINDKLKRCMKIRDNLGRLAKRNIISPNIYKTFRNKLTNQLRKAKEVYYSNKFQACDKNIKNTWEIINSVIKSKQKIHTLNIVDENAKQIEIDKIPDKCIDYFTSIANNLSSQLPPSLRDASYYLTDRTQNTFIFLPTDANEVCRAITDLKDNGKGIYKISTRVLEYSKMTLSPLLAHIINTCVNQGYFPVELKTGCITPIYKNGNRDNITNYRPICSLSPFSKIFERLIYNRMISFIEKYNLLSNTQFGFRKNMSTETALINYINKIHDGLNKKHYVMSIFMDLSKAFDLINHSILKHKLEHYGFRGTFLDLIMSYVQNRQYFVSANGHKSSTKTVNIGVPQGSILGPLLFILYINDMKNSSDKLHFSQFADDSTATYSSSNLNTCQTTLKTEFIKVLDWLNANKLIINLNKTNLMVFTNKTRRADVSIDVNNHNIKEIKECKFLGIMLDNKLNWHSHINYISNKISKSVAILRLLKYIFPKNILKTLYLTLVYPYIIYCNIIWGSASKTALRPLILLQKKCLRVICKANYLDHTDPLFSETKLLKVKQIFKLNCAKFIYKCYNSNLFPDFRSKLVLQNEIHSYNTRGNSRIRLPYERLIICRNSFFHTGISIWNDIPPEIKDAKHIYFFRRKMLQHLLSQT